MPKGARKKLISHTRPKHVQEQQTKWSSKKTRTIIRTHHQLQKKLAQAKATNDSAAVEQIQAQIEEGGGLSAYQRASTIGQTNDRGGDTSKILIQWLKDQLASDLSETTCNLRMTKDMGSKLACRMLEVGCLKSDNACARSGLFEMKRIDLQSQHPDIDQQDFMLLSPPDEAARNEDGYDIISLSLVLNYVSNAADRGEMLRHAGRFLRDGTSENLGELSSLLPGIFLVLPRPCVDNSRYLDETKLVEIMSTLGYELVRTKYSTKLAYLLWKKTSHAASCVSVPKKEILMGTSRNNFAIILNSTG